MNVELSVHAFPHPRGDTENKGQRQSCASLQVVLRESCSICNCSLGVSMGGGELKLFLLCHFDPTLLLGFYSLCELSSHCIFSISLWLPILGFNQRVVKRLLNI